MRRFVAYATLAASMLVAVGVGITPVLTSMQPGREFTTGKEITFNVRSEDDGNLPSNALNEVANEMRNRLDSFDFEDYSIKIENNFSDTDAETKKEGSITVSLACEQDTFDNVCRYLTFSGENFSLSGKDESGIQTDVIDYKKVEIVQYNDLVPILVIPLTNDGKSKVEKLVNDIGGVDAGQDASEKMRNRSLSHDLHDGDEHEHEGEEEPATPDIFLWGNYVDGDDFDSAQSDPAVANKVIMSFLSDNIWYTEADGYKGDEEHTAIKFVCGSMDEENESYDFGKLKNANNMANYYYNMLHASKYDYEISCPTVNISASGFDYYTNARDVAPFAGETNALFNYSNILTVKFTVTILTTLILLVALSVCFGIFFKLMDFISSKIKLYHIAFLTILYKSSNPIDLLYILNISFKVTPAFKHSA